MAAVVDIICGICYAHHTNKAADHWCRECDEGLCLECQQGYHGVSKGTRNHDVIDIGNYKKLPSSVLGITNHCTEHNMKYQLYCPSHEALCCPVCISSNHKKCNDLMAVPELIKTSKSSTLLESVEQGLQDLKTNIENIIQDRQNNLSKPIQEIKLTLFSTFTIPKSIRGCIVCPDGKIIFANESNKKLIIMNENGTREKEISTLSCQNDVTMIDDKTVAIATDGGIYVINIGTGQTERIIKTSNPCDGITYYNDTLLWCERVKGLQMLHLSGNNITTLVNQNYLPNSCYVAAHEDKIYQTNNRSKSITCYTTKGDKIWEFRDDSFQYGPIGVTVDNYYKMFRRQCRSVKFRRKTK